MCVFSVVIKPALGNIIRRGGEKQTTTSRKSLKRRIRYLSKEAEMAIIYQWKLERLIGDIIKLRKKEVKAKETANQYRAVDESFINFNRTLSKTDVEAVSTSSCKDPIYSSVSPSDEIALINLKGWYRKYTDQKIAVLTAEIEKQKSRLEHVESLEVENDTKV